MSTTDPLFTEWVTPQQEMHEVEWAADLTDLADAIATATGITVTAPDLGDLIGRLAAESLAAK